MERIIKKTPYRKTAASAARVISSKKAEETVIYDVRKLTSFTDYIIISTVNSTAQLEAVSRELKEKLDLKPDHTENGEGGWMLIDYGGFVVNLFFPESREFYGLERIWGEAAKVRF